MVLESVIFVYPVADWGTLWAEYLADDADCVTWRPDFWLCHTAAIHEQRGGIPR